MFKFGSALNQNLFIKKSLSMLQYSAYRMQVPADKQQLLNNEETKNDRVVKAFFTQFDDHIRVYQHSNSSCPIDRSQNFPRNSWYKVAIPLKTNLELQHRFVRFNTKKVRNGRLLEIMDYIASTVSYNYTQISVENKVTIVTAVVDHIEYFNTVVADQDLHIQGYVTYVGNSSIEVQIDVLQIGDDNQEQLKVSAIFLMVARDGNDHSKSFKVPQLNFEGEDNVDAVRLRYQIGKKNQSKRKTQSQQSLWKKEPTSEEIKQLHSIFMQKDNYLDDPSYTQINKTKLQKNILMHVQDKNLHGKIFGGHVMREAIELGWLNAYLHCKGKGNPEIFNIDDIQFLAPVDVGSTLFVQSKIAYVQENILHTQVECAKINPDNTRIKTNDLHITFQLSEDNVQPQKVYPHTYSEGIMWLDAQRRINQIL